MTNQGKKIAIFIAGPYRYVNLVADQIHIVFKDYNFDCFFYLWMNDLGNKTRKSSEYDLNTLRNLKTTKAVILAKPYSEKDFEKGVGLATNSNSSINATMGMFQSISTLCSYLNQLPDFNEYKYILRLRTDCAILSQDFPNKLSFSKNVITVSKNPLIPDKWISDHIMFATVKNFFLLWKHQSIEDIYHSYNKGGRNPERTLAYRFNLLKRSIFSMIANRITLNACLDRFVDYHIVYDPPREEPDPAWINSIIKENGIKYFFQNVLQLPKPPVIS